MLKTLRTRLKGFARDTEGNMSLEAAIWLPLILVVLTSTFALHDAFRHKSLNTKAAFTISDAISRETDPLDDAYIDGMMDLLEYLTRSEGPYSLRVTLVRYDANDGAYEAVWSQARGGFEALEASSANDWASKLPTLLHNERVVVVETETDYQPPFPVQNLDTSGLFYNFVFTRPRFAPQIVWDDGTAAGA